MEISALVRHLGDLFYEVANILQNDGLAALQRLPAEHLIPVLAAHAVLGLVTEEEDRLRRCSCSCCKRQPDQVSIMVFKLNAYDGNVIHQYA